MSPPTSTTSHATSRPSEPASTARGDHVYHDTAMPSLQDLKNLDPCGATASMFLYVQGTSIVCCHHDSLDIERRFTGHETQVSFLVIDNYSQHGAGRLAASADVSNLVMIWDLMTGDKLHQFTAVGGQVSALAWMRNGNLSFGSSSGAIVLFEPSTQEHISFRTLEQTAITALAPSADCRTFAIGYQTGSLLIATLEPRFTILHNLSTSRAPSPIVTLAWHASSSRQKTEMLAVQKHDGDLRVWSVSKHYSMQDPAKVVRILRKAEPLENGPNWMGWSKNGRVIQFSDNETLSWDVRTKHVTFDSIPTLEHVRGMAVYGPAAHLFTIGAGGTVQQFDLNSPAIMVANVQHPTSHLPPSPPNSIEEAANPSIHSATTIHTSESESSIPLEINVSESDEDHLSPYARIARGQTRAVDSGNETYESVSPVSSRSGPSSLHSRSSAGSRTMGYHQGSITSLNTYISAGTTIKSSIIGRHHNDEIDACSTGYSFDTTSVPSMASSRSLLRPSRLRHEVPRSPDDSPNKVYDLFKFTRTRLSDIPYKHPINADNSRLTNDDLRRQMLSTIFGWHAEVEDLIRDEMSRHASGSTSRILLAKWLGDIESDIVEGGAQNMTSSDWMLLALSGIGGQDGQQKKLGRTYVQRLLETGDIHVAVAITIGMGDPNDAIEIYVSHRRYMEALLLACLAFPSVWERQAAIIRKWGEWAVQHHQQQLAIRCFACTGQESTEPWRSPSAAQLSFQSLGSSLPETLSPPLSPPDIVQYGPQRSVAKSSALKLITSFGEASRKSNCLARNDGGQTPIAAGVTPIADSAISHDGSSYEAATAFLRPSGKSRFNTPVSARPSSSNASRGRLPSIGEAPGDVNRTALVQAAEKSSRHGGGGGGRSRMASNDYDTRAAGNSLVRAATASPMMRDGPTRAVAGNLDEPPPSPDHNVLARIQESKDNLRNGSRDRIPGGKLLQLQSLDQVMIKDPMSPEQSATSSTRPRWPTRRRGPGSIASSITSNSSAGRSFRNGRQQDDYIHSLEAAKHYSRNRSRGHSNERASSPTRHGSLERRDRPGHVSEDRGRAIAKGWIPQSKRSPTSPIPMSPEDLANLSTMKQSKVGEIGTAGKLGKSGAKGASSRTSSRGSKRGSPTNGKRIPLTLEIGGSLGRDVGIKSRSPPSPVPLSAKVLLQGSDDEEDLKRAMQEQEAFRAKHSRSVQGNESHGLLKRATSKSGRREDAEATDVLLPLTASTKHAGDLRQFKEDDRLRRKEQAARELEERRQSLARRAHTPGIVHPDEYAPLTTTTTTMAARVTVETSEPKSFFPDEMPQRSVTAPPKNMYGRTRPMIGLPATPKAMRLMLSKGMANGREVAPGSAALPEQQEAGQMQEPSMPTLLPSTVYQPPSRPMIPRSMSAPIPDDGPQYGRGEKMSTGGVPNIDAIVQNSERRRSNEESVPTRSRAPAGVVTAPPLLKELQHLAVPPPPPPVPLPHTRPGKGGSGGAVGSGLIEIVMDDEEQAPRSAGTAKDGMVAVGLPRRGHERGRSVGGEERGAGLSRRGSEGGRGSRKRSYSHQSAVERVSGGGHQQPPPVMYDQDVIRSPIEGKGKHMSTGLHRSEMI